MIWSEQLAKTWARSARPVAIAAVALVVTAAPAFAQQRPGEPPPPRPQNPVATEQAPAPVPAPTPDHKPGFLETFGRWMDDSFAGMRKGFNYTSGLGSQAVDAAKTAATAAGTAAKDAATSTAGTVGRLPGNPLVSGSERCTLAPNGAPDCKAAAETLCKSKGFATGNSVDYVTAEKCPTQVMLGRPVVPADCTTEHVVTRAICH
jgi:hypothetical protein